MARSVAKNSPKMEEHKEKTPQSSDVGAVDDDFLKRIDKAVGAQVRLRRTLLGLSQQEVGNRMGLTFQQLQKYEHGTNRISASRLFQLAEILHVPVSFFFDDVADKAETPPSLVAKDAESAAGVEGLLKQKKTLELVRGFYELRDHTQRSAVFSLIRSLARKAGSS